MLIVLDLYNGVPVYRQIVEQVRFQAAAGMLAPGEELPSTRALSQELGVNPMTVSKAYSLLETEGVVTRRPGLPLVVSARPPDAASQDRAQALRGLLEPAVTAVRQLGIEADEAAAIFCALLKDSVPEEEREP